MNKTDRVKSFTIQQSPKQANVDIKEILENKKGVFSPRNNQSSFDTFKKRNSLQSKLIGDTDIVEKNIL